MPDMAEAYKIWGNALQRMGKTGEAMTCYAKAVEIKPNLAEVYGGIADIYAQQSKWQQAIKQLLSSPVLKYIVN
jgi:tetratricopeptide (TPR) repeat protein